MNKREQILLLQQLMQDIRTGWDVSKTARFKDKRVWKCRDLISDLHTHERRSDAVINWFVFLKSIGLYLLATHEGRILRGPYANGGYKGLQKFHRLSQSSLSKRSEEFKKEYKALMRYPFMK